MAVFQRISKDEIRERYTHYAWFFGIVPIYFNVQTNEVCVRNWVPEWTLDVAHVIEEIVVSSVLAMNPMFDYQGFSIKITDPIER